MRLLYILISFVVFVFPCFAVYDIPSTYKGDWGNAGGDWISGGAYENQPNNIDATDPVESEGTLTLTHPTSMAKLRQGLVAADTAATIYMDRLIVDDAGWIGD